MKTTNLKRHGYEFVSQRPDKKESACSGMLKHITEKKHTIEEVREFFEKAGCVLLSTEYKNQTSPLDFTCVCNRTGSVSAKRFFRGQRCNNKECMETRKKATNMLKFNSITYTGTTAYIERKRNTSLAKYGVEDPQQFPAIRSKTKRSSFALKDYMFPSGKVVKIQGYEHFALDDLLKSYDESELLTEDSDQPEIWWKDSTGKTHRYYSDIYIPCDNTVVEVKSTYTARLHAEKLKQCRASAEMAGYNYDVLIYTEKGELIPGF
jgi:hypothetical protein